MLLYSYKAQPSVIWWNLVRLGESHGELIGAGDQCDDETFVEKGVTEEFAPILIKRAEAVIDKAGDEYKAVFMSEYNRIMTARIGLKTQKKSDFDKLFSDGLDLMEGLELDFNHFFRRLSLLTLAETETKEGREQAAARFFHHEGITGIGETEASGKEKIGKWLEIWRERVVEDWGESESSDQERIKAMKAVNPSFFPRGWLLDEVIKRVEHKNDRQIMDGIMKMTLDPFRDAGTWGWDESEEKRFCGDVPRFQRAIQCSCSS